MKASFTVNPTVFSVDIASLNLNTSINPREDGLDMEHVQALMCDTPDTYPPIWVATLNNDMSYIPVDGYHRIHAAKAQKATRLNAQLITFTVTEFDNEHPNYLPTALLLAAYEANTRNGKPLTMQERKMYALMLYFEDDTQPFYKIAKQAKLSDKTVKAFITKNLRDNDKTKDDTTTPEEKTYSRAQQSYSQKLVTALAKFYDNETALLGNATGTRSETKRAKALVSVLKHPNTDVAEMYESLSRSLIQAANIIRENVAS